MQILSPTVILCNLLPSLRKPSVSFTAPGATQFTLTPSGPHSTARCLDIPSDKDIRNRLSGIKGYEKTSEILALLNPL